MFKPHKFQIVLVVFNVLFSATVRANNSCEGLFEPSNQSLFTIDKREDLVSEFQGLEYQQQIPSKFYNKFNSRELGELIVKWVAKSERRYSCKGQCASLNLMQDSRVIIQFSLEKIDKISALGFLNQHQSRYSGGGGVFNDSLRRITEDKITGLKMSTSRDTVEGSRTILRDKTNRYNNGYQPQREPIYQFKFNRVLSLRPKSGLVMIDSDQNIGEYTGGIMGLYGNVAAVMKSEVKKRTLWVIGDSYSEGLGDKTESGLAEIRGTFEKDTLPVVNVSRRYIEALIYGEVTLEDVDHFLVIKREDAERLKKFGKPIYLTKSGSYIDSWGKKRIGEPEFRYGRHTRDYLELLFEGNVTASSPAPLKD